jgi:nitrite reductase (NADH) small subunit
MSEGRWIRICNVDEVPLLEGRRVMVEGFHIALFHTETGFYAVSDVCPHQGGPLSDGDVAAATVSCPLHARKIDLRSGECMNDDLSRVPTYPAMVRDGHVLLDVATLPCAARVEREDVA